MKELSSICNLIQVTQSKGAQNINYNDDLVEEIGKYNI